jgi:hypothetical protein
MGADETYDVSRTFLLNLRKLTGARVMHEAAFNLGLQ